MFFKINFKFINILRERFIQKLFFFVVFNSAMLFDDKLLPIDKTHIKPESLEFFLYIFNCFGNT